MDFISSIGFVNQLHAKKFFDGESTTKFFQ